MTAPVLQMDQVGQHTQILEDLAREIALVEEELNLLVQSRSHIVESVSLHTLNAGGKRLRPAFVIIGAKATGNAYDSAKVRRIGASMEMIHMATLIHDDVIDNSTTRRGKPTAAAVYGNRASILSGDALLAKATVLLSKEGVNDVIHLVSGAVVDMAEGEVREVEMRGNFDLSEEVHLEILDQKTASFIRACCETGAVVAGADDRQRAALRHYGQSVGMAFQIVDDLLDYRGNHRQTGKPRAIDFREGQATLPLIYLRPHLSPAEDEFVRARFGTVCSDDDLVMIEEWMKVSGAFAKCEATAARYAERALEAVSALPNREARELMSAVAARVLDRQF